MKLRPVIHFTSQTGYEQAPPFHPEETYPEFGAVDGFGGFGNQTAPSNPIYAGVRTLLRHLRYDATNYGSARR